MIELKQLHIGYANSKKNHAVFNDISLTLNCGELVGIIGDNGVGKSTLLKTLVGNLKPLSGQIIINGKANTTYSANELAKLISIVTTEKIGGFSLTAWDVVATGRTPYLNAFAQTTEADEQIINNSLKQLSIMHLKDAFIDELSDGQRQKVMIAKSLAQQAPIIVLDEPTAFLDYSSKIKLFELLQEITTKQNKLIIVSSHDLDLMNKYIKRSVELKENSQLVIS